MDVYEPPADAVYALNETDPLSYVLTRGMKGEKLEKMKEELTINKDLLETVDELEILGPLFNEGENSKLPQIYNKLLASVVQAPKIELKKLPDHLNTCFPWSRIHTSSYNLQ